MGGCLAWPPCERYFGDPALAEEDKVGFSWAAFNAGPANVNRMRKKTKVPGLDPNRWFGNVEQGALAVVGQEAVQYVRSICKYYITCKSLVELHDIRERSRQGRKELTTKGARPVAGVWRADRDRLRDRDRQLTASSLATWRR